MATPIHYIVESDVQGLIPAEWLVEALDDNSDNTDVAFASVQAAAEDSVNGVLSMQYRVPIENPGDVPFLKHVTRYEFARLCYARRKYAMEAFPHKEMWKSAWDQLSEIGSGERQLSPAAGTNQELAKPRGSVISAPSKTISRNGSLSS